ncbi:polyphosphate kinase 2 [Erythrobacter arachoides]|uniref:ADP/GDP-polyphosphate phosphotransferase n=1 Tax=Aurantiacibacter arachoides TaxID=1850444 RepID=A0A844ZVM0_9SPHN|nr:polyphosphate kinase 2 [Aurantiacibacter arachoides]MXO92093.1 polyphosphate kinase 2 [Aurantiacibacter arachoides]GGD59783.1 transcriptional regulator [Aurantiacibacter arachoides]
MKRKNYDAAIATIALELVAMARWARTSGQRICVVFEGRDTAGKGGTIDAIAAPLDPRHCRVVALPKPNDAERSQWYFQRYVQHLPAAGEIVLFDRSWYNRAGVEQVMGFATPQQVDAFLGQAPVFEKLLVDDGIRLFKYWLSTDQAHQEERFAERLADPLKRWKLSPIDLASRMKFADYTAAREGMFAATHTRHAPWTVVDFNDQRRGRLTLMRDLLDRLPDFTVPEEPLDWPPLDHPPLAEEFGHLHPIPRWSAED